MLMAATGTAAAVLLVLGIWLMIGRTGKAKLSEDSGETMQEQTTTSVPDTGDDAGDNSQDVDQDFGEEDPVKLSIRSVLFILLALFSDEIINTILTIGGTPYRWIMDSELPPLSFADFNSVMLVIIGVCANGAVALITLILVVILAWNYLKLLLEAAERYVLLGVLVYTAPVAFAMGASQTTSNIWKSWCRMLGGQIFLLLMNAWCLRLFTSMVGSFISNPLSL